MKKNILIMIAVIFASFLFTQTSFADEPMSEADFAIQTEVQMLVDENKVEAELVWYYGTYCYAQAPCRGGGFVWCEVFGTFDRKCKWKYISYVGVECVGIDAWGNWRIVTRYCP
jgi:hypothetical protein